MASEKKTKLDRFRERADAFVNRVTGMGTCEDPDNYTQVAETHFLRRRELEETYKDNALAARIVDRPAMDSLREGWYMEGTDEAIDWDEIKSDMEDLGLDDALLSALKWSRLFGGCLLIPLVDDGQEMDKPLNVDAIKSFSGFRVVDRWRAQISPESFLGGAGVDFTNPEYYFLSSSQRTPDGELLTGRIHKSRVIRFDGVDVPYDLMARNGYWGMSVLQPGWRNIRALYTARGYLRSGLHTMTGMILKVNGLTNMLKGAGTPGGGSIAENVRAGVARLRNNWTNNHWLALDKEDSLDQSNRTATGLADMGGLFVDAVVMDYDIPRELLVHELKGALTTGEAAGSIRLYYDHISADQRVRLTPAINRILEMYFAATDKSIDQWTICWNPLWQQTERELAEVRKFNAEVDNIYFTIGALEAEEIRIARFENGDMGQIEITPEMEKAREEAESDALMEAENRAAQLEEQVNGMQAGVPEPIDESESPSGGIQPEDDAPESEDE
jgi:phage-related protein (TIGR01555 family)